MIYFAITHRIPIVVSNWCHKPSVPLATGISCLSEHQLFTCQFQITLPMTVEGEATSAWLFNATTLYFWIVSLKYKTRTGQPTVPQVQDYLYINSILIWGKFMA